METLSMIACSLVVVAVLLGGCQAGSCSTIRLTNAISNSDANGLYDVTSRKCSDRNVYIQRVNTSDKYYMYYGVPQGFYSGWIVGKAECDDSAVIYNWNNNKRPDYTLRYWLEMKHDTWIYNFDLRVQCTEGLTFGELIGVIIGSIVGGTVIVILTICLVRERIEKQKTRRRTQPAVGSTAPPGGNSITSSGGGALVNAGFQNDGGEAVFEMPPPPFMMAPPNYEEVFGVHGNGTANSDAGDDTKPPSYEQAIAAILLPLTDQDESRSAAEGGRTENGDESRRRSSVSLSDSTVSEEDVL